MQTKIKIDQDKPLVHQSNLVLTLTLARTSFVLLYRRLSKYIFYIIYYYREDLRCLQNFIKPNQVKKKRIYLV